MSKKINTEALAPAGAAVPDINTNIPAHKRAYITRHGGRVELPAPAVAAVTKTETEITETESPGENTHA